MFRTIMMVWRMVLTGVLTVILGVGCKSSEKARPSAPKVDKAAVRKMLEGTWSTSGPDSSPSTYVFQDDNVEITHHKQLDSATQKPIVYRGKLEISGPNSFSVKTDEMTYLYRFVKLGGQLHLGNGNVFKVANLEEFRVELGMGGWLRRKGGVCTWTFGRKTRSVKCPIQDKDGKKTLKYQTPSPFDKNEFLDSHLYVVEGYLIGEQMMSDKAHKVK